MKGVEHYYQETSFTCGPASLLIAYRALGIEYNETMLALEVGTTDKGTYWGQMFKHAVVNMDFPVELRSRSSYKDLMRDFKRGIIIVAWSQDEGKEPGPHYSVISGITDDLIEITDPGLPKERWPSIMLKDEFVNKWFTEGCHQSYLLIKPKSG
jgi:hypothetical protein